MTRTNHIMTCRCGGITLPVCHETERIWCTQCLPNDLPHYKRQEERRRNPELPFDGKPAKREEVLA